MKAAITGRAWRTPLGGTIDEVLRRLLAGERAARVNPRFDASSYACSVASAIPLEAKPTRNRRFLRRMGLFAVDVAVEAFAQAELTGGDRVGLFFGYGGLRAHWDDMMPALSRQRFDGEGAWERGLNRLHPFWMLQHLSNNAHAIAAQELSISGEGTTCGGANAGAQALVGALQALAVGAVDAAVVVAYDTFIEPETLVEMAARGVVTTGGVEQLAAPYDRAATGFVPGEAAAGIVLRRADEVTAPLAFVEAAEGADGERGEPLGATIARVARRIACGGEIVDGAGRSRPALDADERRELSEIVGPEAALCCTLSAMGQLGAAAPLVQTVALAELLRRGVLPPIAGLREVPEGPLRPVRQAEPTSARAGLGLSTGAPGLVGAIRVELP